jgi:hypothetical protein
LLVVDSSKLAAGEYTLELNVLTAAGERCSGSVCKVRCLAGLMEH